MSSTYFFANQTHSFEDLEKQQNNLGRITCNVATSTNVSIVKYVWISSLKPNLKSKVALIYL